MTQDEQDAVLHLVHLMMSEHPTEFRTIIDAAVAGVKKFSEEQNDRSSACAARLITVLEGNNDIKDFGMFGPAKVLEALEGCYGGTPALKNLKKKYIKGKKRRRK